ncbi:MAG TPA: hypothetical protein VGP64_07785 [Polyangia bacterium]|jgi:hypothetical protein
MKWPRLLLALLFTSTGWSSACSWIFVKPLPDRYERGDFADCTTNAAAPVIDTLFTLTNVGSSIYVAGEDNVTNKGPAVTAGLLVGALWLSSAIYGYSHTSECRDAKEDADDRPSRRYVRPRAPAVRYQQPTPAAEPSVTVPPPAPTSPGQQEDEAAPTERPSPKRAAPLAPKPDAPRFGG